MEILGSVAAKIAEYTVEPIARPVCYLFSYKDNFSKLESKVDDLMAVREETSQSVEDERRNGKIIYDYVLNWLGSADEITEEAKKLCEDPRRGNVGCSKWWCPNLWWRQQLSGKAVKLAKEVAEVHSKGKFRSVGYLPPLRGVGSISSTRHHVDFESRMSIIKQIMGALADHNVSKLGVYGLGGVGKSTLVKQVAAEVKARKLFEVVIARVTKTPDVQKIQGEIADQLGLHFTEETVVGRSLRLRERIKMEKSILIILDDLWDRIELEEVGIPDTARMNMEKEGTLSTNDHTVCKVLLTSRIQEVLRQMETQKDFRLEVLSAEETWRLFEVKACDAVKNPTLQHTATEVARKCAGLPVLIVTLASGLNKKDIHAWKDVLNELERVDNRNVQEITYSALELSYKYLGNDEIKALFLLCGVMGPNIQVEYLLKCVMALGIFKCIRTIEDARDRLCRMIGYLKASCLLLECDTGEVKMHGLIHDVAVKIVSRDQPICMIKKDTEFGEWPTKDFPQRCPKMILDRCHIHKLRERLDCPELQLFYLYNGNSNLVIPDSFFEGMGNLTMLDLTCMELSSLPMSFGSLINLKTLCLDQCALGDMAAIAPLKNIEILSLYQSSMTKLPSEIGQLTNLRMLDLSNSEIKLIPPNIISSLTKLEELYMGNTFIDWEVEDLMRKNENASLAELRQLPNLTALNFQIQDARILPGDLMLEKLERYKIFIGDVWEWFGNYKTSKVLKLKLLTSIHLEHGIKSLTKRVEELFLDQIYDISNVLYQLNTEGFPVLKHLHIQNNEGIQHIVDSLEWNQAHDSFPNLETLVLHNLHNLQMICHGPLAVNSFKELRVIKVESCCQLIYLFTYQMIKGCSQLLEIDVSNCSAMKNIVLVESGSVVGNGMTTDKIEFCHLCSLTLHNLPTLNSFHSDGLPTYTPLPFLNKKVVFPNLETLKLCSISSTKLWDDDQLLVDYCIQNLTNLIIEDCGNLKYLFSSSMVGSLLNLKRLEISKCHMMEEIIETTNGAALDEVRFSKLETIIISDMKKLKKIWHYQSERLRTVEVKSCENIVIVFPADMRRNFHNLETLMVTNCASVKEIFELDANETGSEEKMAQLRKLTLIHLPKLKQIWSKDPQGVLCYHNLQVVHVEECENLEYLFPLSLVMRPWQLKEIIIKQVKRMKEIVVNKEGPVDGSARFVFNRLTSLVLWNLHKLERFYAGNHTLACPSLEELFIFNCTRLNIFKTESLRNRGTTSGDNHNVLMKQSLFTAEEIIPNLERLTLNNKDASMLLPGQSSGYFLTKLKLLRLYGFEEEEATFPTQFLQNAPSLEWLIVDYSSDKIPK